MGLAGQGKAVGERLGKARLGGLGKSGKGRAWAG